MPKRGTEKLPKNGGDTPTKSSDDQSSSGKSKKTKIENHANDWTNIFEESVNKKNLQTLEDNITEEFLSCMGWKRNKAKNQVIRNIIKYISVRYNANNYHNFHHASHVTLNCACLLKRVQVDIPDIEKLSLLFSAVIHDVEHLGVPNASLVKKSHELAILYNDQSVAENRSIAIGLELLKQPGYDLLDGYSEEERMLFRHNVIELVLCTDIAEPMKKLMTCVKIDTLSKHENNGKIGALDVSTTTGRVSLMSLILRVCDLGAISQSFHTQQIWCHRLFLEQKAAAIADGHPPTALDFFYTDQVTFMSSHAIPQLHKLMDTGGVDVDFMQTLIDNVEHNIEQWKVQGEAMLIEWDDSNRVQTFD